MKRNSCKYNYMHWKVYGHCYFVFIFIVNTNSGIGYLIEGGHAELSCTVLFASLQSNEMFGVNSVDSTFTSRIKNLRLKFIEVTTE